MDNYNRIPTLTDLDETVEHLLPPPMSSSSCIYSILLAATLLLSILSVFLLI